MRKALGLLACTSLAAAGLWTTFPGGTTRPVSADQPSSTRGTVLNRLNPFSRSNKVVSDKDKAATYRESAEKLLKEAQALALRGDLDGARQLAERAQSFPVEWGPNERSPEKFLAQLDARTNFKNQETAIAASSKPQPRRTPAADPQELPGATRAANSATQTPRSQIQPVIAEEPIDAAMNDDAAADDLKSAAPIQPASQTTAEKSSAQNAQLKDKAKRLMQQARQDIAQGNYAAARDKAEQAAELDVAYTVFDQRPQQILAELDRRERQLAESRRPALDLEFEATPEEPIQPTSRTTVARPSSANTSQLQAQAKQLMQQARQDIARGDLAAAREKAEQAAELDVAYSVFEPRPQQLLAEIERLERGVDAPARRSGHLVAQAQQPEFSEPPFEAKASSKELPLEEPASRAAAPQRFQTAKKATPQSFAEDIPFEDDVSATTPARKSPGVIPPAQNDRQLAQQLLQQAEAALKQGNLEQARALALEAQDLEVTYSLFDLRPEQVLARIDRADNNLTIARGTSRTKPQPTTNSAKQLPFENVDSGASSLANDVRESARRNVPTPPKAIKTLNPHDLIDEVMAADDVENASKAAAPMATATKNEKPINDPVTARVQQQAASVLQQARQDLESGRLEAAREKAIAAQKLNATYGLFDDRPEVLLEEIDTQLAAKSQSNKNSNTSIDSKAQALALLKQARADIAAERWEDAKQKALAASALNVTYDVFDDRPEQILAAVQRATNPSPQKSLTPETPVPQPTQVANQTPPKTGDLGPLDLTPAPAIEEAPEMPESPPFTAVHPEGPSAQQLFREGQIHLQSGNKAAAYQAFVRAYQSGQKLDARRHQQLQDYLRELSPRRGAKPIQLASGSDNDANATEPGVLDLQRPIDIASERQKVQLDRLRSEVLNAVSRADRLREKDPAKAIEILDQAMANVETAPLEKATTASLLLTLRKTRSEIEGLQKLQEPNLALAKRNAEVLQSINRETAAKVRIEKEFANLTKEYNELMNQRRYAEAEVIAKQAKELDPDNPVAETMLFKSVLARRVASNEQLIRDKEEGFWSALDAVEQAAIPFGGDNPIRYGKDWKDITDRRRGKYNTDTRVRTPEEQRIENSLSRPISLHFENAPLKQVMDHIATVADVNVVIDKAGLDDEALTVSTPVSINVDSIQLKNALELMLEPLNMGYTIKNEVLKITSEQRLQGEAILATYSVADLVVPIVAGQPNMNLFQNAPFTGTTVGGQMSVPTSGGLQGGQFQVGNATPAGTSPWLASSAPQWQTSGNAPGHDFRALIDLIVSTCEPSSWEEIGGSGHIKGNETTLSLVIRQTQKVHNEIRDLLEQLRRLQDLQVTIEVRFVSVSDNFFERIGIDFDFDLQDSIGGPNLISSGQQGQAGQGGGGQGGQQQQGGLIPIPPFGSILPTQQQGQQQQGQQGQQAQQGQAGGGNFFTPGPRREFTDRDRYRHPTVLGMNSPESFTDDLDVAFRQGSFGIGVPDFGRFDANAGINVGFAILSDIETFFFINAAQGDRRNNIMSAPKVTMFNGQTGTVFDGAQRPFVTQLIPVVGAFAVGYQPIITQVFEGVGMSVSAVISADRRYVRLAVTPSFNVIREVQAFTFVSAGGQQGQAGQAGQRGGGQRGGGQGGFGGGQQGFGGIGGGAGMEYGGIYNHGLFGTAMGDRTDVAVAAQSGFGGIGGFGGGQGGFGGGGFGGFGGGQGGFGGGGFGGQGGQGGFQAAGAGEVTVQQPVVAQTLVLTTVAVPDGGTVLLGGVKRLSESRNMAGVPILNKIPYISRLFKNTGVGRETQSLMLMVTPRIVILEEEESLLGIPN